MSRPRWICKLFGHSWNDYAWNAYMIVVEQRCACGAWRHHLHEDQNGFHEPNWRDGRHPFTPREAVGREMRGFLAWFVDDYQDEAGISHKNWTYPPIWIVGIWVISLLVALVVTL